MKKDYGNEDFYKAMANFSEEAGKTERALKTLQSAFVVLSLDARELIEANNPEIETPAKEISECALARAKKFS